MPNGGSRIRATFTSCERSIILYYVEMIMRLIPLNFYFSFFFPLPFFLFKLCTPVDVPASGIFTRYFEFISVILLLSLQGSAKRCFSWLLLLDLRLYLFFFFYIFFFFLILYYALVLDPHRADIRFNMSVLICKSESRVNRETGNQTRMVSYCVIRSMMTKMLKSDLFIITKIYKSSDYIRS